MPWIDLKKSSVTALVLALGLSATAAAADTLVVRSSGPSARNFPAGRSFADSASIALRQNDVVVVFDGSATRTLKGPGTFALAADAPRSQTTEAATRRNDPHRRIGAVRSPEKPRNQNP